MKRFLIFFAVFALASAGLFSEELSEDGNRITAVSVTGLKRTKPHVVEGPLQKFIGRDAGSLDKNEVIAIIQATGVVEPLTVEIEDNLDGKGKTLAITVRDKWSIFPVPFFGISQSGWSVGGAFMDTNFLGRKDMLMVTGSGGTGGWMANAMYFHSPDMVGEFGWSATGMFLWQDKENVDQTNKRVLRRYNSMTINPSVGVSYKLTDLFTPTFGIAYKGVLLRDTDNPVNAPEGDMHGITFSPGIGIKHNTWDGYFLNEQSASLKYDYTLVIGGPDVHTISLNGTYNYSFIPGFRIMGKSAIILGTPSASPFFEASPINASVNILPQTYSAVDYSSLSIELEKSLYKFKWGLISISAGYQIVYSNSELLHNQFDHGPVAMAHLFLNRVAIPAIGLGGSYNVDKNTWQYAFSVGMTF
ncbi:MAG: hypothetical protein Ta2A_17990 [Treponemataceae bacterium]|nr:MAG: hypothetical protein Ta2A_17990 [Treponemataceae bacterium]